MKEKWDKLKELSKNKYTKPLLFFGFYFIFFAAVISLVSVNNDIDQDSSTETNMWNNITNNYEYLYEVELSANKVISFEGKQYNHKNLFVKRINGIVDSEVYTFYDDVLVKENNEWVSDNNFILINNNFNNQYFDINYIKSLVADSELTNSIVNFDETKSDLYTFGSLNMKIISKDNVLKVITIIHPLYKLTLQYKNINNVSDFVVEK